MGAAYGSAGERCIAQSVAVAVGGIGDKLVELLSKKVEALKVGLVWTRLRNGSSCNKRAFRQSKGLCRYRCKEGAKLVVDGRNFKIQGYEKVLYWRMFI